MTTAAAKEQTLAVLGYHRIGPPPPGSWESWFSVPEQTFVAQLRYLEEHDWRVISLAEFLAAIETPDVLGERSVLLTFDDGYRTLCYAAARVLAGFGFPAVCFVPSDFIGRPSSFSLAGGEPEEPVCDTEDLRTLGRSLISVQSHGASHRAFSVLDQTEQERELAHSKAAIEAVVEHRVEAFAFPYGDVGGNGRGLAAALRRNGYRAAFTYSGRPISLPIADPYRLPRIAMGPDTDVARELAAA